MTFIDFVEKYNKAVNDAGRKKVCSEAIERKYVPVLEKYSSLLVGLEESTKQVNSSTVVNSVTAYIVYVVSTVVLYTKMELGGLSTVEVYDLLKENECLDDLLSAIPKQEIEEMERIYNLILSDRQTNELSTSAFMARQSGRIEKMIIEVLSAIQQTSVDEINAEPSAEVEED